MRPDILILWSVLAASCWFSGLLFLFNTIATAPAVVIEFQYTLDVWIERSVFPSFLFLMLTFGVSIATIMVGWLDESN
jgi:hypothetical protein